MAPRTNQKNRTRDGLLSAARELMSEGEEVTLAKVAERAKVGRATVYRYFSDPGVMALDATLDVAVTPAADLFDPSMGVRDRVHSVARYYLDFSRDNEAYFRQFLAESLKASLQQNAANTRGARRVSAFAEALEPVRAQMKQQDFDDLTKRLSMTTGMEQFIIVEDILRVDPETALRLQAGVVDSLLDRYLPVPYAD